MRRNWVISAPMFPSAERRRRGPRRRQQWPQEGRVLAPAPSEWTQDCHDVLGQGLVRRPRSLQRYANRLPRGRTYVRNGSVIDLQIPGKVEASSAAPRFTKRDCHLGFKPLVAETLGRTSKPAGAGKTHEPAGTALQGRLSKDILVDTTAWPEPACSPRPRKLAFAPAPVPIGADMCKHVAAGVLRRGRAARRKAGSSSPPCVAWRWKNSSPRREPPPPRRSPMPRPMPAHWPEPTSPRSSESRWTPVKPRRRRAPPRNRGR